MSEWSGASQRCEQRQQLRTPAGRLTALAHTHNGALLARYAYTLDAVGNRTRVTETAGGVTREISNTYDALNRQIVSAYSTGEAFTYRYDAVGNRVAMTSTTPLSGTVVTTYTFDAANRLTDRVVSDGRTYTYTWSNRGQMLAEYTGGVPVRTFAYDGAGQMVQATVFTLTTEFVYNGLGARVALSVTGATTRYTLDYAAGQRILAETTPTSTVSYLYGHDCLGEFRDDEPLYYLPDAEGYVRQGVDADGAAVSAWLFDPDGTVLEGPDGPVSHLVCGGVYDWSTGLLYKGGRYFDPALGIWLVLLPLMVVQAWPRRKKERRKHPWVMFLCIILVGTLTGCPPSPTPDPTPTRPPCTDTPTPVPPTPTPEPTPTPTPTPTLIASLPPSYVYGVNAVFRNGNVLRKTGGAGVIVAENTVLSHHHHTGGGFMVSDLVSVEILDASDKQLHFAEVSKDEVAMLADAEMGWSMTLIVFRDDIWTSQNKAILGNAGELKEGDAVLQSVSHGAAPGLYSTNVVAIDVPITFMGKEGASYNALKVSPDSTQSGDSGSPLYDITGQVVYGVNNSGSGNYGPINDVGYVQAQITNLTQSLRQ